MWQPRTSKGKPNRFVLTLYSGCDSDIIDWLGSLKETRTSAVRRILRAYVAAQGDEATGPTEALNTAAEVRLVAGHLNDLATKLESLQHLINERDYYAVQNYHSLAKEIKITLATMTENVHREALHRTLSELEHQPAPTGRRSFWDRLVGPREDFSEL